MITFFTLLTKQSGFGNYYRCKEVYKQLKDTVECEFYLYTDEAYTEYADLDVIKIIDPLEIEKINSDIVIYDLPFIDNKISHFLSFIKAKFVVSFNDATLQEIRPNLYFNTDNLVEIPQKTKAYLGLQYQIIRSDLKRKDTILTPIKTVGVMFGGSDPDNLTLNFIKQISEIDNFDKYYFKIITSSDSFLEISNEIEQYKLENITLEIAPNMENYYSSIDALINMGGMSTYEAMYVGIPVFSVEWKHMSTYVKNLSEQYLICNIGSIETALKKLNEFLMSTPVDLGIQMKSAQNILDGFGAKRIALKIQEALGEII